MRESKPPKLAIWLLEHFATGKSQDALLGDLLETFRDQRRSALWFWRQALLAVLINLLKTLRAPWLTLGFSAVWSGLISSVYGRIWHFPPVEYLHYHWLAQLMWPLSLVYELLFLAVLDSLLLLSGLIVYFGVNHLPVRRCMRAIEAAFPLLVLGNLMLMLMSFTRRPVFVWYLATGFVFFTSLLLSLWAAQPGSEDHDAETVSS